MIFPSNAPNVTAVPVLPDASMRPPGVGTPTQRRGGPRTPDGKRRASQNAVTHGLSATTRLPEVLGRHVLDGYVRELTAEWRPTTPTQHILVQEIARHAAALERIEQAEQAALRFSAAQATTIGSVDLGGGVLADEEIALAAAANAECVDRITRYRRAHEKGLHSALQKLTEDLHRRNPVRQEVGARGRATPFASEDDCVAYLVEWSRGQPFRCPRCHHPEAVRLATRQRRQCAGCRHQVGIRHGTLMHGSRVPLLVWFRAIAVFVKNPEISAADFAKATGLHRPKTARRVLRKIRDAATGPDARQLLAGLDTVFQTPIGEFSLAASSAPENPILQNELKDPRWGRRS